MFKRCLSIMLASVLLLFTVYALLNTFVLSSVLSQANFDDEDYQISADDKSTDSCFTETEITTDTSYSNSNICINLTSVRDDDDTTTIYIADVKVKDMSYFRTAFANSSFGTNIVEKTTSMAKNNNAILAINGDYYGAQRKGYVMRNGVIFRSSVRETGWQDLVVYNDGSLGYILEGETSLESVKQNGGMQVLSFGPNLIVNGEVVVTTTQEVSKSMANNPRTAIGMIDNFHFIFMVADGRTTESKGLKLYQLANFMLKYNVKFAYNLDGGGSSTMVFNGKLINNPTTNGKISERAVSDIVYIAN